MNSQENEKLGFAGKLASIFVLNSRLSILLIIALFAWGIFSFFITPKQYNPEIIAPAFQIVTEFPGATEEEVEKLITDPLESIIQDLDGVEDTMSQSISGGVSIVTVKFFVGEDLEESKIKLSQKIFGNINLKPFGAEDPIISELNPDEVPIFVIALSNDKYSLAALRKLALDVKDELKEVENSSNISVHGGRQMQAKILLDPHEMNAKNVSIFQIQELIQTNNLTLNSGELEAEQEIQIQLDGSIQNIEDLKEIAITTPGGELVYLEDIADIKYEEEEAENYVTYKKPDQVQQNAVFISVAKKKGSNITQVTEDLEKKIEQLQNNLIPTDVEVDTVRDEGQTARGEINGLIFNLAQAIFIVFLVLYLFLGSRAALVVAISIPLTLASVFGIGLLGGQTINRITLFALILSLGLLVDNATVVVENIVRHLKMGKEKNESRKMSVIKAVDEVGVGLIMSTVTTLFAFYPMAFVTGMMGPYMGPIPFFVPAALIVSLIIAFTINPFLSSQFLDPNKKSKKILKFKMADDFFERYKSLLHKLFKDKALRKKFLMGALVAFLLSIMLPAFGIVKFRMLPKADREQFYVYLDFPEGTLIEENAKETARVEEELLQQKEILSTQAFIGTAPILDFNGLFKGASGRNQSNHSTIKVNLTHHNDRSIKSEKLVQQLRPHFYDFVASNSNIKIKFIEDPPGPPVISTVLLKIKGPDQQTLEEIAYDVESIFQGTDEVVDIDTTRTEKAPKIYLQINREKAQRSNVNIQQAAYVLRTFLSGNKIDFLHNNNKEQEFIVLRLKEQFRDQIDDLQNVYVSNSHGEKVPLLEITDLNAGTLENIIQHDNGEKTMYVYAEMGSRSVTYAALDIIWALRNYPLSDGYSFEWGGEWDLTLDVFRDLGIAMAVAIFLVYLILVAQFHSFKTPLIIMGTIPLAMIGVLPGFALIYFIFGIYFNATSMIGVIALAGIVVNNAIILIEYLNGLRKEGLNAEEAIVKAAVTRFRPILLTSITTVLGSLTIVGDPVWAGLAWSIIFGVSISTVLTLVIFPILYYTFEAKDFNCPPQNLCESQGPSLS